MVTNTVKYSVLLCVYSFVVVLALKTYPLTSSTIFPFIPDSRHAVPTPSSVPYKELTVDNIAYTSPTSENSYNFNTADKMNELLVLSLLATGGLCRGQAYDLDFGHQFIDTEKYDAKPTYKKFTGYSPGVAVVADYIVGIENRDGNANVRFCQQHTLERIFTRLEKNGIRINRARMDCGSCSEKIVDTIKAHCKHFYIRANRCSALYDDMFVLSGWKTEEINGIEFELNSILVEKWKGKAYRLVIQRQKRIEFPMSVDKVLDIAKTLSTITIELPNGENVVKTLFLTQDQNLIEPVFAALGI